VFSVFVCNWAATAYFSKRFDEDRLLRDAGMIVVLGALVMPILNLDFDREWQEWFRVFNVLGSFANASSILLIFLTHFFFFSKRKGVLQVMTLAFVALIGLTTQYVQFS